VSTEMNMSKVEFCGMVFFFLFLPIPCTTTDVEIFTEENHSRYMERGVKVNGSGKKKVFDSSAGLYRGGMRHFHRPD
jgi:hypothetical protein